MRILAIPQPVPSSLDLTANRGFVLRVSIEHAMHRGDHLVPELDGKDEAGALDALVSKLAEEE